MLVSVLHGRCEHRFGKVPDQFSNHLLFIGFSENHSLPIPPSKPSFLTRLFTGKNKSSSAFIYHLWKARLRGIEHG